MLDNNIQKSKNPTNQIDLYPVNDLISLYDPVSCTRCNSLVHLTADECKRYRDETGNDLLEGLDMICHYTNGNNLCPASVMHMATYVDIDRVVKLYLSAFNAGDIKRMQKILTRITAKGKNTEMLIMQQIKDAMEQQVAATVRTQSETTTVNLGEVDAETKQILVDAIEGSYLNQHSTEEQKT